MKTQKLINEYNKLLENGVVVSLLNLIPTPIFVLNKNRETVFANNKILSLLGISDVSQILGFKPGNIVGCVHTKENEAECGEIRNCIVCGNNTILNMAANGGLFEEECVLNTENGVSNYTSMAGFITIDNADYIIFSLVDVSPMKQKMLMERIFYHDILNAANNIYGVAELLNVDSDTEKKRNEYTSMIRDSALDLLEEINTHRLISSKGSIKFNSRPIAIESIAFIDSLAKETCASTIGCPVKIDENSTKFTFYADRPLLKRVVLNMLKNALEASCQVTQITIGIVDVNQGNTVRIWVHNSQFIPESIQLQIFNRSFSTKAPNRGLGTYSMKILTDKYLLGKVFFTSSVDSGTKFIVEIPNKI